MRKVTREDMELGEDDELSTELSNILGKFHIPNIKEYFRRVRSKKMEPAFIEHQLPQKAGEYAVIAGKTGIGKTVLALYQAFCLSTGTLFYDYACRKAVVGYLALEGDDQNMMDRYEKMKKQFPDTGENLRFELLEKERPEVLLRIIENKMKGCDVVIFDGSRYLVPGDYCNSKDTRNFIISFMRILKVQGVVGIITLQAKKSDPRYLLSPGDVFSIKGATELVDDATTAILLEKTPHSRSKDEVTLYFAKTRIATKEMPEIELHFNLDKCIFEKKSL